MNGVIISLMKVYMCIYVWFGLDWIGFQNWNLNLNSETQSNLKNWFFCSIQFASFSTLWFGFCGLRWIELVYEHSLFSRLVYVGLTLIQFVCTDSQLASSLYLSCDCYINLLYFYLLAIFGIPIFWPKLTIGSLFLFRIWLLLSC